ncbi:MAG: YdcF family protein, partial [Defluviitaleaceae bacterium]|nr:YdcF family protein [Defluviitaleaceae bacterium]
ELYAAGFSRHIVPAGGVSVKTGQFNGVKVKADIYNGDYQTEYDCYADVLVKNGVPTAAIIAESASGYTKQNATFSKIATDQRGLAVRTALIVCKSFHARRCLMCYQLAFPAADIRVVPVDVYDVTRDNWHTHAYGIDRVLGELSRCGNQFVEEMKEFAL